MYKNIGTDNGGKELTIRKCGWETTGLDLVLDLATTVALRILLLLISSYYVSMLHTIYGNQLVNLHLKTETYKLQLMCSIRLCVYWSCSDAKFFQSFREYITVLQTTLILKAMVFRHNKLCGFENMIVFS
jgi:hypothetical protein